MHELISLWMSWVQDWGYAGVIVLMAMESSIFPVPSEVVIPPAAILSAQDGASMSFWGVVVAGTFGSWLGSAITYAVARIVFKIHTFPTIEILLAVPTIGGVVVTVKKKDGDVRFKEESGTFNWTSHKLGQGDPRLFSRGRNCPFTSFRLSNLLQVLIAAIF